MQYCQSFTCYLSLTLGSLSKWTSLSHFYRYYFSRSSSELHQLVTLPFSQGRSAHSDRLHDFSVTIPICYKDIYVNRFFPHTARLWNSLPVEYFPLTYDLNGFKACVCYFVSIFIFTPNDSPLKTMKNAFYFI